MKRDNPTYQKIARLYDEWVEIQARKRPPELVRREPEHALLPRVDLTPRSETT